MNERDRERAWSRDRERVRSDVARAGWGCLGGVGAREREWLRLGNMRGAERVLRALAWSERHRGSGELEVGCLAGCQSKGEERGLACTRGAARWGHRGGGEAVLAW
jgi:hypothetical protein